MATTAKKVDRTLKDTSKKTVKAVKEGLDTAREKVVGATESAEETYEDLKNRAEETTGEARRRIEVVRDRVGEEYSRAQDQLRRAGRTSEQYVNEHPVYTAAAAAVLGFLLGWLLRPSR